MVERAYGGTGVGYFVVVFFTMQLSVLRRGALTASLLMAISTAVAAGVGSWSAAAASAAATAAADPVHRRAAVVGVANQNELNAALADNTAVSLADDIDLVSAADSSMGDSGVAIAGTTGLLILGNNHLLDGGDNFRLLLVTASSHVTLRDLTMSGGIVPSPNLGGGIYIADSTVVLTNVIIQFCEADGGGGIYTTGTGVTLLMESTQLLTNFAKFFGAGLYSTANGAVVTMQNGKIDQNELNDASGLGGGIYMSSGTLTLAYSEITRNIAGDEGGGLYLMAAVSAPVLVVGCLFGNNEGSGNALTNDAFVGTTDLLEAYSQCPAEEFDAGDGALECAGCVTPLPKDLWRNDACVACAGGQFAGCGSLACSPTPIPAPYPATFCDYSVLSPAPTVQPTQPVPTPAPSTPSPSPVPTTAPTAACSGGESYTVTGGCVPCPAGRFSAVTSPPFPAACEACAAGNFEPVAGSTGCGACAAGKLSSTDRTFCTDCAAGEYALNQTSCERCEPGRYAPQALTGSCIDCGMGHYTNLQLGSTLCLPCAAGTVDSTGVAVGNCSRCSPGTYAIAVGLTACADCEAGKFADASGSSSCTACSAGYAAAADAATACVACAPGYFVARAGATECAACDQKTYSAESASLACTACTVRMAHASALCPPDFPHVF